jgi:Cyanate permease
MADSAGQTTLPVWVLGFACAPIGVGAAATLVATPQLLASRHVAPAVIASLTAFALAPGFVAFLFGPLLDWRLPRKTYAILFYCLGGLGLFCGLNSTANLALLAFFAFVAQLAITLGACAVGGWFSSLVAKEKAGALGAWFTAWNIGAGGAAAIFALPLMRVTSVPFGAAVIGLWAVAAVALLIVLPCKPADGRLARESISAFARDVAALLRAPIVLWTLLIFLSPAASFALTNIFGGLGGAFHTSEAMVSFLFGAGAIGAAVIGSLSMPVLERFVHPRFLYLWIGLLGALCTALILVLPRETPGFIYAVLQQNLFQSAAFSVCMAIILRSIGPDNPLAATQFSLLNAAFCLPLTYMQVLDAEGLARGGVQGALITDAAISAAACLILLAVFSVCRRRIPPG